MSVRVFAPAKINLTLEVGRPGADGYHPLQSVVTFADVGDWIEASPADALSLEITGPFAAGLPVQPDNLVLRAARALDAERGAALKLAKNLPIASGIGGGSSDAAATLIALNQVWDLRRSDRALAQCAVTLGADVPVCVGKHSAWMTGDGREVTNIAVPQLHVVLVNPGAALPTAQVYRRFDELKCGETFRPQPAPVLRTLEDAFALVNARGNDLEQAAVSLLPELRDLLLSLRGDARAACAGLSGSGATCFALTRTADRARALAADLKAAAPSHWIAQTRLGGA